MPEAGETGCLEPNGMMNGAKQALLVTALIGLVMGLSSCREDELGRPMVKEKGVYEGPADEKLGDEHVSGLRSRAAGQKF